jgi:membrane-bound metal-dependent hydrolase YbcI (DUF457 family)
MPFTISHAAAVLPLKNSRLPMAALMIGSMSPDFAYFTSLAVRDSSHDFDGLFLFCWPVGLAVWLLFVRVLERPTIELLPAAWRNNLAPSDGSLTLRNLALASLGVIIGALTHIAWDAFTHPGTPVVNAFPALSTELFTFRGRSIRVFLVLQYLCSVIGLLALAHWAWRLRHATPRTRIATPSRSFITDRARVAAALLVVAASAALALASYADASGEPFERRVFHLLIGGMTGWALAWCAVALLVKRHLRTQA